MSPLSKFELALRGLVALDMQELVDAGAIADRDYPAWDEFQADRVKWLLAHPVEAQAVWLAIWRHLKGEPATIDTTNLIELDSVRTRKRQAFRTMRVDLLSPFGDAFADSFSSQFPGQRHKGVAFVPACGDLHAVQARQHHAQTHPTGCGVLARG